MKNKSLSVLLIFLMLLSIMSFNNTVNAESDTVVLETNLYYDYDYAYEVLDIVNEERAKENLTALKMDKDLLETAMLRANEIAFYFSHTRTDGTTCYTAFPTGFTAAGENIAGGQTSPESAMEAWMNSEGHKANILTSYYDSIGIGVVKTNLGYYWVQCFETRGRNLNETTDKATGYSTKELTISSSLLSSLNVTVSNFQDTVSIKRAESVANNATVKIGYTEVTLSDKENLWTTSDPNVCTVDYAGNITAVNAGTATVTFNLGNVSKTCNVTVYVPLESISLDKSEIELNKGKTENLTVIYNPTDTTDDKTVQWSSSNTNVASVDSNGTITAVGAGTATITAKVGSFSASANVNVKVPLEGISFANTEQKEYETRTTTAQTVIYNPEDTTDDKTVNWKSSNEEIATIDSQGNISCLKIGTTTITAQVGNFVASYQLTVEELPKYTLGDVNEDGSIDIKDVRLALQYSLNKAELTEAQILAADVDVSKSVDIKDVKKILQYALNKITEF